MAAGGPLGYARRGKFLVSRYRMHVPTGGAAFHCIVSYGVGGPVLVVVVSCAVLYYVEL